MKITIHEGVTARKMERAGKVAERCQTNRDIKEINSLRQKMMAVAKELTQIITEKARDILGRFKEFRRDNRDTWYSRRDAKYSGKPAKRDRDTSTREAKPTREARRISRIKRAVGETSK